MELFIEDQYVPKTILFDESLEKKANLLTQFASFFAFYNVRCSYDKNLSYLEIVEGVPIRYYHNNKSSTMLICNGCYEDIGWNDPVELSEKYNSNICQ